MIQVCEHCGCIWGGLVGRLDVPVLKECPWCKQEDALRICPSCGKSEAEVTFDKDTFTSDCDECVGFRFAFSRAYQKLNQERGLM